LFNIFGRQNYLVLLNEDLRTEHRNTVRSVFDSWGRQLRGPTGGERL
jgi:hypothetical protein